MNQFRIGGIAALLVLAAAASPATVPFSFTVIGGAALTGPPVPAAPVGVILVASSASFAPLGNAEYSEEGEITFGIYPSGAFAPISGANSFTASFNNGADSFFGTDFFLFSPPDAMGVQTTTSAMTILGGSGIFADASGFATGNGTNSPPPPGELSPVFFSGSGQITAPGLAAVPEPASMLLFVTGLGGVVVMSKKLSDRFRSALTALPEYGAVSGSERCRSLAMKSVTFAALVVTALATMATLDAQ